MAKSFKQSLIAWTTFLSGLYFFLQYILPETIPPSDPNGFKFGAYYEQIIKGVQIVSYMALGLGIINIFQVHGSKIVRARQGWINSFALVTAMLVTLGIEVTSISRSEEANSDWQQFEMLATFAGKIQGDYEAKTAGVLPAAARVELIENQLKSTLSRIESQESYLKLPSERPLDLKDYKTLLANISTASTNAEALRKTYEGAPAPTEASLVAAKSATELLGSQLKSIAPIAQDFAQKNREQTKTERSSRFIQKAFFESLGSAMFALLAFYIASAAYRAFRIKSVESSVMMLTAIVMILGQIPQGPLFISEDLPSIRLWLLKYLSTPAFRAIFFGATVAGLAMTVRMWLSLERSPLSSDDEDSSKRR